ncbi:MAG: terminase gpA endonuclease subunit [Phenylobacterium sp.]|uniref:terminase gpA endonuclease subunit n=1 Tax=Phenylobacterium sp. TaxID=1871053 RepID=UPI003BB5DAD0
MVTPADVGAIGAALLLALAQAVAPPAEMSTREWSTGRVVIPAEANTARPGPLSFDGYEYCLEPLERLRYDDPCKRVTVRGAAQTGKSNIGVVHVAWTICVAPRPMGLAVPSGPKASSFNSKKLQPVIDKTPDLNERVVPQKSRDSRASTTTQKNYPGGSLTIFSAGSVNDLQSESFGFVWITESPNFLNDVGGRGSPVGQIRTRMDGWEAVGTKELHESTPGEEGSCPVSADFDAGDRGEIYLPCPHCDQSTRIDWDDFVVPDNEAEEPYVVPPCCGHTDGAVIRERDMPALKRAILWTLQAEAGHPPSPDFMPVAGYLRTYPSKDPANPTPPRHVPKADFAKWRARPTEGREPSYQFWQVLSPQKTWRGIASDWRTAKGKPSEEATFRQQKLALPTEAAMKAPGHGDLLAAAQLFKLRRGEIPVGTCWISCTADIQGDRIEWATHAHGPTFRARIDRGVIEKDPLGVDAWADLAKVLQRRWEGPHVRPLGIDAFGVDSGGVEGVTPRVYEFVRGRANCYAIKGASTDLPLPTDVRRITGKDTRGRTIKVIRLLVDTYVFKKFTAYSLNALVRSGAQDPPAIVPGSVLFEDDSTEEDFRQLTAESFRRPVGAKPGQRGEWVNLERRPNEQLDLDVYAQALAYQKGIQRWDQARWEQEFHARGRAPGEPLTPPLLALAEAQDARAGELPTNPGAERPSLFASRSKL